jgi:hypothetical protein
MNDSCRMLFLVKHVELPFDSHLVHVSYREIVHDVSKIGIHSIQHSCHMIFIGVFMCHHVVTLFMHHVGHGTNKTLVTTCLLVHTSFSSFNNINLISLAITIRSSHKINVVHYVRVHQQIMILIVTNFFVHYVKH